MRGWSVRTATMAREGYARSIAVLCAIAVVAASCASTKSTSSRVHRYAPRTTSLPGDRHPDGTEPRATATTRPSVTTTTGRTWPTGPFSVTSTLETVVRETPGRTLKVSVRYPPKATGPYPLFLWLHGLDADPDYFASYLDAWASAGYVVAAPEFPGTSVHASPTEFDDYVNQPADVTAVLDRLLDDANDPESALYGLVAPDRIAVGGHSLGAVTAEGLTEESCCVDRRIRAAILIDYGPEPFPQSTRVRGGLPQLVVHGELDTTFPLSDGVDAYQRARGPKALVVLPGVGHTPFRTTARDRLVAVTTAFLNFALKARSEAGATVVGDATASSGIG
jgi:dipeptidyl aminopeptidase/acylaminoacyl peptidase